MKEILLLYIKIFKLITKCLLSPFKQKIILIGYPTHSNLGDQAQLLCTYNWIKDNYPNSNIIPIPCNSYHEGSSSYWLIFLWSFIYAILFSVLKFTTRKSDLFIGHSGYFIVDHHGGWTKFAKISKTFPHNKFIIFPQTINMYNPYFTKVLQNAFNQNANLILLCRDEVSYNKAKQLFPSIKLLLYPDIVTSLIGSKQFNNERNGILFCMRNDVEAYYSKTEIQDLMNKFTNKTTDLTDTSINVSETEISKKREYYVSKKIEEFAHYELIITDRYHGTIFSQIASTPVIVITSTDHKLSSGVKWFPKEIFKDKVYYAENLEKAYDLAQKILSNHETIYLNSKYFKENYWDKLYDLIQ